MNINKKTIIIAAAVLFTIDLILLAAWIFQSSRPKAAITPSARLVKSSSSENRPLATSTSQPVPPTATFTPLPTATIDWRLTPDPRPSAENWRDWPVIPDHLSPRAIQIYTTGLAEGRNPYRFSKVGDCQSTSGVFLAILETRPEYPLTQRVYRDYPEEATVIAYYEGSLKRESLAVANGMSVNAVLSPLWADPDQCEPNEHPLACEIRVWNPSIIIISLGTVWQKGYEKNFDNHMREIIDYAISQNVLPIMVTKADNVEDSDFLLNMMMANIAREEQIPLWNFWGAVQKLPHQGIDMEGYYNEKGTTDNSRYIYLTANAWEMKTVSGLQTLHAILTMLQEENAAPVAPE